MDYQQSIAYLDSFIDYERSSGYDYQTAFKVERIRLFLATLGDPQRALKIVHVAGTKGKGSVACYIAHILKSAGLRAGLYTSPHLHDLRERIRILDASNTADEKTSFPGMILKSDLSHLVAELRPRIESFHRDHPECGKLTYFEILTALAFLYFRDKGVDWVALETGLGGRLDATNAADAWVTVITPISYDHQHLLGPTLPEIAFEKAGIIKRSNQKDAQGHGVCVTAPQERDVLEVLRRRCRGEGVVLFEMERDFSCRGLRADLLSQDFFYQGLNDRSCFLKTRMLGGHQLINASVAVAACEALSLFGVKIPAEAIREGVAEAFWPGRLEVVRTRPFILLDGAHNGDSAGRLAHFLEREFKGLRKWLVFGASQDKNIRDIARQLEPVADAVILTKSANPRSADPAKMLKPYFKKRPVVTTHSVEEALEVLQREIKGGEVAVVTGSLFVVAEARVLWQK